MKLLEEPRIQKEIKVPKKVKRVKKEKVEGEPKVKATILKEGAVGGDQQFNRGTINLVTSVRIRETLEQVQQDIQTRMRAIFGRDVEVTPGLLPSGVILTGGASQLAGLAEATTQVLSMPARLGVPVTEAEALRKPEYACVLGIMAAALVNEAPPRRQPRGIWAQFRALFRL